MNTGVINQIITQVKSKLFNKMAKNLNGAKKGRITGISKLDDANDAGNSNHSFTDSKALKMLRNAR